MKLKVNCTNSLLTIKARTFFREQIDVKELERFKRMNLRNFLKPIRMKSNVALYTAPVAISLEDRLRHPFTKKEFLLMIEQIVVMLQSIKSNSLKINNLLLTPQNVYINIATKELFFLYIPVFPEKNKTNISDFIESIVYSIRPAAGKDSDFAAKFIYFYKSLRNFDCQKVENYIAKEDKSVVNTIRMTNPNHSGFMTDKQRHYIEHYEKDDNENDDTGLLIQEETEETVPLDDDYDDQATGLLNEDEGTALLNEKMNITDYPTLNRVFTQEKITINKPVFRIGKEKSYVDYFVTDNIAVSRSHADIISRGNSYYIKDLNSKNHTYLNDQEIPSQYEIELKDQDRIRLGNEEFIFYK